MSNQSHGDDLSVSPRIVLRGVKNQLELVHLDLDSLYLVVEYPHSDVFKRWAAGVDDITDPRLYEGIVYERMVLRRGGNGYKLSVWDGDARLYMTDRVNDEFEGTPLAGQGMGVMLQLGPKWLSQYGKAITPNTLRANVFGQLIVFGLYNPEAYPIRINRLDIALDIAGLDIKSFSVDEWLQQWVGYAKLRNFHFSSRSGDLTGFSVGSYKGSVRFKVYDKVTESEERGTTNFWRSIWGMSEDDERSVTRFEWSVNCYKARFAGMRYLHEYSYEDVLKLLNYVTLIWGRLCIPQEDANHKARWPLAPLWVKLRSFIKDWSFNYDQVARREYDLRPDLKPQYLASVAGWLAGMQARLGVEKQLDNPASLMQVLAYLQNEGHSLQDIYEKAHQKWEVYSKLAGGEQ